MLQVMNIGKHFRKKQEMFYAVKSVNLSIVPGEIYAFLGPNGAGKTTTIKMIAGLVRPDEGEILIDGLNISNHKKQLSQIGAVLEGSRNLYWRMTPLENLCYFAGLKGMKKKDAMAYGKELLTLFDLGDKMNVTVQRLSRGMQQKVAVCAAMIHRPKLLLLDEPTLGLDFEASEKIKELIKRIADTGVSILLTTHQLDIAQELADRVGIIRQGSLVLEGDTDEILQKYSRNEYSFKLANPLPLTIEEQLIDKGAVFVDSLSFTMDFSQKAEIYEVIHLLAPNPLVNISLAEGSLTEVFKEMISVQ
ncbi:ABC transporter ATP-binding protein [Falsibacillus albus]|uniref:ABC transporter ATP-binding protein n=1 Tax=Falsibacillus albus TaxID=2478915 RepID=UPI00131496F0|nr:ABC transporter ATP-binding protein [Falsibacillus albus]